MTIKLATTDFERHQVYRFRYQVYVEEMQRVQTYANHDAKTIIEPFDRRAHILAAFEGSEIVGTIRANFARESDLGYYTEFYDMRRLGTAFPGSASITTKLMIVPQHRRGTLAVRLAMAIYDVGRDHGITHDFIDCNPHLEPFFRQLGYLSYKGSARHPEYGDVLPMLLDLDDFAHLSRLNSPFVKSRTWKDTIHAAAA